MQVLLSNLLSLVLSLNLADFMIILLNTYMDTKNVFFVLLFSFKALPATYV